MKNTCFNQKKVGDDGKKKVKHYDRTKKKKTIVNERPKVAG